jgi:outer membrane protein assembly factor BamD
MAGFFYRTQFFRLILIALFAGPFCLSAKAQAVQAQSGSTTDSQQPQPQQKKPDADKPAPKPDQAKATKTQKAQPQAEQKKIKAHVVKADTKKKKKNELDTTGSAEPDKVLYERAKLDIQKGKYTEGRLSLQALINTYPDSEYLAKAKLGVADSYYKEGGTSNLTQAIEEYKNFIIFFPFLDDAAYAQMQIGMGHLRMMEKSDRDSTHAQQAEQEFQTFLLKYPRSPFVPKAEQDLRNVQEILADGEYRIARFYFLKQDYPASAARLIEVAERYPLYSQSDEALWMLAEVYAKAKLASRNEDDKNHWADLAGKCYARIVRDYPLSHWSPAAKTRLKAMGMDVPSADPQALALMKDEQLYQKHHHQNSFVHLPMALLKTGPSLEDAARSGTPNLNPPDDAVSAREVLQQGAKGPDFDLANKPPEDAGQNAAGADEGGGVQEAVPGSSGSAPQGTGIGVQIITPPDAGSQPSASPTPTSNASPAAGSAPQPLQPTAAPATNPPATTSAPQTPSNAASPTPAAAQGNSANPDPGAAQTGSSAQPTPPNAQTTGNSNTPQAQAQDQKPKADKADSSTESSSKKKKGVKKIIPW